MSKQNRRAFMGGAARIGLGISIVLPEWTMLEGVSSHCSAWPAPCVYEPDCPLPTLLTTHALSVSVVMLVEMVVQLAHSLPTVTSAACWATPVSEIAATPGESDAA